MNNIETTFAPTIDNMVESEIRPGRRKITALVASLATLLCVNIPSDYPQNDAGPNLHDSITQPVSAELLAAGAAANFSEALSANAKPVSYSLKHANNIDDIAFIDYSKKSNKKNVKQYLSNFKKDLLNLTKGNTGARVHRIKANFEDEAILDSLTAKRCIYGEESQLVSAAILDYNSKRFKNIDALVTALDVPDCDPLVAGRSYLGGIPTKNGKSVITIDLYPLSSGANGNKISPKTSAYVMLHEYLHGKDKGVLHSASIYGLNGDKRIDLSSVDLSKMYDGSDVSIDLGLFSSGMSEYGRTNCDIMGEYESWGKCKAGSTPKLNAWHTYKFEKTGFVKPNEVQDYILDKTGLVITPKDNGFAQLKLAEPIAFGEDTFDSVIFVPVLKNTPLGEKYISSVEVMLVNTTTNKIATHGAPKGIKHGQDASVYILVGQDYVRLDFGSGNMAVNKAQDTSPMPASSPTSFSGL